MSLTKRSVTCFKDLSNGVIYDIFDCLDFCHIYDSFSNLNDPLFPMKSNLSAKSKSTFHHYYTRIVILYQHRIKALQLSYPFINDLMFSPDSLPLKFIRLEKLIVHDVKSKYLENLLNYLLCLSSLVLISKDRCTGCSKSLFHLRNAYNSIIKQA
jgi:hypothetical protein